jgi:hypothetical protein
MDQEGGQFSDVPKGLETNGSSEVSKPVKGSYSNVGTEGLDTSNPEEQVKRVETERHCE